MRGSALYPAFALLVACGGDPAGGGDSGIERMDSGEVDAGDPGADAGDACTIDAGCDDGLYCNGTERCTSGVCTSGTPPCAVASCDESADTCSCTEPDGDRDGFDGTACGGNDCDDTDMRRNPAAAEICDAAGVDEDCDPMTYGFRDADMDDAADARCRNTAEDGTVYSGRDCDDMRAGVNPSAPEVCDGTDNDCDGATDEGVTDVFYVDADGDDFGVDDPATNVTACFRPDGFAERAGDCDDTVQTTNPNATDECDAANVDDDCDGTPNNREGGCSCTGTESRACLGARGVCMAGTEVCLGGVWGPCSIQPSPEACDGDDDDCDGTDDDGVVRTCFADTDGDTYAAAAAAPVDQCPVTGRDSVGGCPVGYTDRTPLGSALDCDDGRRESSPAATEVCNGLDDDCDGSADELLTVTCYADSDGDTHAAMGAVAQSLCPDASRVTVGGCPVGTTNRAPVAGAIDCNDTDSSRSPSVAESCNGIDDDCDGSPDDGVTVVCYAAMVCPDPSRAAVGGCPVGRTNVAPGIGTSDCNDAQASVSPMATEICDAIDNDCDGTINEGTTIVCYPDSDDDGYSPAGATVTNLCPDPTRVAEGRCPVDFTNRAPSAGNIDCADDNPLVRPNAAEVCDGLDNNCSGSIDEGVRTRFYRDADNDTFGNAALSLDACTNPGGYVTNNTDCNDMVGSIYPGQSESCNGFDDNCNGSTDEGFTTITVYRDADGDGRGNPAMSAARCGAVGGYVANSDDCNDASASVYLGASEICGNGIDEDCSGTPDDNTPTWYRDDDGDTYGRNAVTVTQCSAPSTGRWALRGGDCNDGVGFDTVYPGAPELCDGLDTDCSPVADAADGEIPNAFGLNHPLEDNDGDGHGDTACTPPTGAARTLDDCNDAAASIYSGAPEITGNEVDDDCNGGEICFRDQDDDGYSRADAATLTSADADCADTGEGRASEPRTDCNDANAAISPGDPELADNALDDDCDGLYGCYYDADDDGYSRSDAAVRDDSVDAACTASGEGSSAEPRTDCNDGNAAVSPADPELADNALDDDCDGLYGCYYDVDNDGYSRSDAAVRDDSPDNACTGLGEGSGAEPRADCNDTNASISPGDPEVADNGTDDDCDGFYGCWYDADSDGYRPQGSTAVRDDSVDNDCLDAGEGANSELATDCNDNNASISPADPDLPDNGIDDNCSGRWACYYDADNDGYSRSDGAIRDDSLDSDCLDSGEGRSSEPTTDCCDTDSAARPGQTAYFTTARTICGGYDYNCDGSSTRQSTTVTSGLCGSVATGCMSVTPGWLGSAPACGVQGNFRDECDVDTTEIPAICEIVEYPRTQACR